MFVDHNSMPQSVNISKNEIQSLAKKLLTALILISGITIVLAFTISLTHLFEAMILLGLIFIVPQYEKRLLNQIDTIHTVALEREQFFMQILDNCEQPCSVTAIGNEGDTEWRWLYVNGPVQSAFNEPLSFFLDKSCYNWGANICRTANCGRECIKKDQVESKFVQDFGNGLSHFRIYTKTLLDLDGKPAYVVEWVDAGEEVKFQLLNAIDNVTDMTNKNFSATKEVADNISTVAAATEELSASSKGIKESAEHAREIADSVEQLTKQLGSQAKDAGDSVLGLAEIGNQIEEISKVIEDIADQTNLLALNAAIEAARAGDNGRGFAVVADEVRELAERTHKATTEITTNISAIKTQIKGNVEQITSLSDQVINAGEKVQVVKNSMESVASSVSEQSVAVDEIAESAISVSQKTEEVSKSVNTMQEGVDKIKEKIS